MKILQLRAYCRPEQVAASHLGRDLEKAFVDAGFESLYIAPTPSRGVSDEVRREYCKRKNEELYDGKIVIRRFSMFREGRNTLQRMLRYLLCNVVEYWKGSRVKDADVIYAGSTPPTQGLLCGLVKKRLKVPFVYNLQDIFPDSLVNAKMTKKGSLIWKIGRKIEDFTYRSADRIIVISEDFKRNIMEKGVPEDKIVVVPNWVDTMQVYPVRREENVLFERYHLDPEKFYVCYSGNIGHSQNLELLLEAAGKLRTELPDVRFVLIGEGAAKEALAQKITDEGIDNVILLPFQPYEEIAHVFSLGDAGLIISKPGIGGSSVPSKTWSIMAAERPIIASFDEDSELAKLVRGQQVGVVADATSCDQLVDAVKQIRADRAAAEQMGQRGRRYVQEYLDKERCTGMYVETIRSVVKQSPSADVTA